MTSDRLSVTEVHSTCVVGESVVLSRGVRLMPYVVMAGVTSVGEETTIYPFSVLGTPPQDPKYRQELVSLFVGSRNIIREHVSINTGTILGGGATHIGDDNTIMSHCHIGHDVRISSGCTISSGTHVAGHVEIHSHATIGGNSAIAQRVRVGEFAFVGGHSGIDRDVPPFCVAVGNRPRKIRGVNLLGLRRHDFDRSDIIAIREAVDAWRTPRTRTLAVEQLRICATAGNHFAEVLSQFVAASRVGVLR